MDSAHAADPPNRARAMLRAALIVLGISVAAGWIEAALYAPSASWREWLWLLALESSLAFAFALPVAAGAALLEGLVPAARLRRWTADPARRATAIGIAWAILPVLVRTLGPRGVVGVLAIGSACAALLACARRVPAVSTRVAGVFAIFGASLAHALMFFTSASPPSAAFAWPAREPAAAALADAPCVLLVSVDTLRRDRVGAQREGRAVTPFLDRLGAAGALLGCRSSGNETAPGHASMLTGANGLRHGVIHNHVRLPASVPTLAELLAEAGWRTGAVISNPVIGADHGYARGFEHYGDVTVRSHAWERAFFGVSRRSSRWDLLSNDYRLARLWMKHLEWRVPLAARGLMPDASNTVGRAEVLLAALRTDDRPWLLFAHFMDPHYPYEPPPATRGRWTAEAETAGVPTYAAEAFSSRRQRVLKRARAGEVAALREVEVMRALYDEEIAFVDEQLARLVTSARAAAGARPLWIVMTADHGEHFLEHGKFGHSNSLYEELIQLPLLLHGLPPLAAEQVPARLEDVPRLLARLLISERAEAVLADGSPVLAPGDSVQIWEDKAALSTPRWKLFAQAAQFRGEYAAVALWDLHAEHGEAADVAEAHPAVVAELLARLHAAVRDSIAAPRDADEGRMDAASRARLAQLGYAED